MGSIVVVTCSVVISTVVVIGSVIGSVEAFLSSVSGSLLTADVVVFGTSGGFVVVVVLEVLVVVGLVVVLEVLVVVGFWVVVVAGFVGRI